MDATASALFQKINENLVPLKSLNTPSVFKLEFWSSVLPSVVALLVAGGIGRYIKPYLGIKPNLEVFELVRFHQEHYIWRLAIVNNGKETAKNVQVDVVKIYDNGNPRENFLPMPLPWTHTNKESRDVSPKQTVYLDVFYHKISDPNDAHIATRFGGGVDSFRKFKFGKTRLILTFYEQSGKSFSKEVEVSWSNGLFLDARMQGKKWVLTKNGKFIS